MATSMASSRPDLFLLAAVLALVACAEPTPPEQRVRNFIGEMETLAEEREYTELLDHIASDYLDSRGNDKLQAAAILRGFFLRNKSVHLLVRIGDISFPADGFADVTVYIGMARRPLTEEETAGMPRTNLHRVDLRLAEDGDSYEILQSEWERASAGDLIG